MKFYGRDSNLTYNDQNIFHEGNKPSWNLKINNDSTGQQVSAGDAVTIKKGNGINITRSGSNVTISNTLAAGDGLALTGTNFKAVAGLGMLVNSSGIHTIFGGNGIENSSARSDHNHDEKYDNYGGFNIKVNSEAIGQKIDSDADINIVGAGATTVSRNGNTITINSKDTIYTHPTSAGNKHIPSGGEANNFLQWSSNGTAVWSTINWSEITGKPSNFEPADHDHPYLPLTGGTLTGPLIATDSISSRSTNGGAVEMFLSRENSGNRSWRFRNENGNFTIDNKLTSDETWTNSLQIKTGELTELYVGGTKVSKVGHTHDYAPINHTHGYDNYGGYFIKNASETGTGQYIASGETVSFKAGNNITVSRNGREISIAATTPTASQVGAVAAKGDIVAGRVAIFNDTTGNVKDSGFTIAKSVPSNAVFTDTNTWRDVVDNLVSTNVDKSLSANQGKVLKGLIDGKANSNHGNHYLVKNLTTDFMTNFRTETKGDATSGAYLSVVRTNTASIAFAPQHGTGISFGHGDTHTYFSASYNTPTAFIGGGNVDKLNWVKQIAFTDSNVSGANKWTTARVFTIGSASKSVDGSKDISWTLDEIGAAKKSHGTHVEYGGNGSASTVSRSDHTHNYLPLAGGTLTGDLTLKGAPTSNNHAATKSYVDSKVGEVLSTNDAMVFKGTLGTNGTVTGLPSAPQKGWTYRVITAGTYLGHKCEVGDLIIAIGTKNESASWTVAQTNLDGAITTGITKAVSGNIVSFDGTTGKMIKDSGVSTGDLVLTPANIQNGQILKWNGSSWVATNTSNIGLPDMTNQKNKFLRLNGSGVAEWYTMPTASTTGSGITTLAKTYTNYMASNPTTNYFSLENIAMTPKATKEAIEMASTEARKELPANANLNDYSTNGTFITGYDSNAQTIINRPPGVEKGFYLEAYTVCDNASGVHGSKRVVQRVFTRDNEIFIRTLDENNGWQPWQKIYHSGNYATMPGATSTTNGIMSKEDKAKLDTIGDVKKYTKSITLTTDWQDFGVSGEDLETGSYMIQIEPTDSSTTSMWYEIHTGMMSWYSGGTNSTDGDEIILHSAGHASNGRHIYLRTVRTKDSKKLKLQIAFSHTLTTATDISIKFRKLI